MTDEEYKKIDEHFKQHHPLIWVFCEIVIKLIAMFLFMLVASFSLLVTVKYAPSILEFLGL